MSLFGKIMEKLGFKKEVIKEATAAKPASAPSPTSTYKPDIMPKPKPMSQVDVVAKLDGMAAKNPQELNWKRSIVTSSSFWILTAAMRRARNWRPNCTARPI
jgi:hypothetical protein